MSRGFFKRENEIEQLLRSARPHADEDLLDRLVARVKKAPGARMPRRLSTRLGARLVVAGGLTTLMAAALAATGSMSYAATTVDHVVAQIASTSTFMGTRMAFGVKQTSAARDQYTTATGTSSAQTVGANVSGLTSSLTDLLTGPGGGGPIPGVGSLPPGGNISFPVGNPTPTITTTSGNQTTETTTALTANVDTTTKTVSFTATTTSKTTTTGGTGSSTTTTQTTVSMPAGAFNDVFNNHKATTVVVDPQPKVATLGNQPVVGVTLQFNDSDNKPITVKNLPDPISVAIPKPAGGFPANYVPAYSTDGTTFTAVPLIPNGGKTLPNTQTNGVYDWQTGYYVDANGNIVILTRHTTIFAAISKVNLGVSESGRKLKKAGSGLFGDASLVHPGPAALKQVGGKVRVFPFNSLKGDAVKFSFFVDEQVSAYVQVFKGRKKLPLQRRGTQIRGGTLTKGGTTKTLHIAVLKPGTLPIRLRVPASQLKKGATYRIRVAVIDFDGNRTVRFIPFKG